MNDKTRYDTSDLPENQFEPGSDGAVLRNVCSPRLSRGASKALGLRLGDRLPLLWGQTDAFDGRRRGNRFENSLSALLRVGQVRIGLAERFRFHAMIIAGIGSGYTRFSGRRGSRKFSNLLANILISVEPWTRDRPLDLGAWTRDLGLGTRQGWNSEQRVVEELGLKSNQLATLQV